MYARSDLRAWLVSPALRESRTCRALSTPSLLVVASLRQGFHARICKFCARSRVVSDSGAVHENSSQVAHSRSLAAWQLMLLIFGCRRAGGLRRQRLLNSVATETLDRNRARQTQHPRRFHLSPHAVMAARLVGGGGMASSEKPLTMVTP